MTEKEIMERLTQNIKVKSVEQEAEWSQRMEIAASLGCDPSDIKVKVNERAAEMAKQGVLVELRIRRARFKTSLNPDDLGLADKEEYRRYLNDYVQLGRRRLIPPEYAKKLDNIESKARRLLNEHSYQTVWGHFVPLGMYDELRVKLDALRVEYLTFHEEIYRDYDYIYRSVQETYREAAGEVYKTMRQDSYSYAPDSFIEAFCLAIKRVFPSLEKVRRQCLFEVNLSIVPLSASPYSENAQVQQVWDEARGQVADEIRRTHNRNIESFFSDVAVQLRGMIYEAASATEENIRKNGKLVGRNITKLRKLADRVNELNFMGDREVIEQVDKIREIISVSDDTEGPLYGEEDVLSLLSSIAKENRQVLLALENKTRATRKLVFDELPVEEPLFEGRKKRGSLEVVVDNEIAVEPPSRKVRGHMALAAIS